MFTALVAPAGLHGVALALAVILAQWAILLGPAALGALWLAGAAEDRARTVATGIATVLALALAAIISPLVDAPRPFMSGEAVNYLDHVRDGSFPSDHATLAFAIAIGLWLRPPPRSPAIWRSLMATAVAIGWARVFLGAHYPSDIAGGAMVGAVAVGATATPPGRTVLRLVHSVGEQVRARAIAGWRRLAPSRFSSGARKP